MEFFSELLDEILSLINAGEYVYIFLFITMFALFAFYFIREMHAIFADYLKKKNL